MLLFFFCLLNFVFVSEPGLERGGRTTRARGTAGPSFYRGTRGSASLPHRTSYYYYYSRTDIAYGYIAFLNSITYVVIRYIFFVRTCHFSTRFMVYRCVILASLACTARLGTELLRLLLSVPSGGARVGRSHLKNSYPSPPL